MSMLLEGLKAVLPEAELDLNLSNVAEKDEENTLDAIEDKVKDKKPEKKKSILDMLSDKIEKE